MNTVGNNIEPEELNSEKWDRKVEKNGKTEKEGFGFMYGAGTCSVSASSESRGQAVRRPAAGMAG